MNIRRIVITPILALVLGLCLTAGAGQLDALERAFQKAADKVAGSVVAIEMDREKETASAPAPSTPQRGRQPRGRMPARRTPSKFATRPDTPVSGILLKDNCVITTNFNMIGNVSNIKVSLADGRRFDAKLLGRDETRDIALLKVETEESLPYLKFKSDHEFEVGQFVVVVGRSENLMHHSVCTGIVSALGRSEGKFVQVDAHLNYGNVGGAIVDIYGNLIGVAVGIDTRSSHGKNSGVGYLLSAKQVFKELEDEEDYKDIYSKLLAGKVIKRPPQPFLGVEADRNAKPGVGAVIANVHPNTAAEKAGLKDGDVVTEFNGQEIKSWDDLVKEIRKMKPGEKFACKVSRVGEEGNSETHELEGEIGERPLGR
ncbi:MAG: S1C family serine protease [Planctomycetota bacterium]|jgi:serine protease Do